MRDASVARAVRLCLKHESPLVRAAAIEAMEAMRLPDEKGEVASLISDEHDPVRRAVVRYRIARGGRADDFARELLEGDDAELRRHAVEALVEGSPRGLVLLTPRWIEQQIERGGVEDLKVAATALTIRYGDDADRQIQRLLAHDDVEIRRAGLTAAGSRARPRLLPTLLPLLHVPELSYAARHAVAANGNAAVAVLRDQLENPATRELAALTLARIATPSAIAALVPLARSNEIARRQLGLQCLTRARTQAGRWVMRRRLAHRLFLRELSEFQDARRPARALHSHPAPELRLLGESYGELAEMALDRGFWALACAYEPRPLFGAFARLKSDDAAKASTAVEYLGHLLPRGVFAPLTRVLEAEPDGEPDAETVAGWIRTAWTSDDGWMRACAVRAARALGTFDLSVFDGDDRGDRHVQAELEALNDRDSRDPFAPREVFGC